MIEMVRGACSSSLHLRGAMRVYGAKTGADAAASHSRSPGVGGRDPVPSAVATMTGARHVTGATLPRVFRATNSDPSHLSMVLPSRPPDDRNAPVVQPMREQRRAFLAVAIVVGLIAVAMLLGRVVLPRAFGHVTHYESFPAMAGVPKRTVNAKGYPADPINVALVGTDSEIATAMRRAGWTRAAPVTRATSLGIAESVLLHRPDSAAPVSPLYLYGRMQDVAYEREVGRSASQRHHVRLWRVAGLSYAGRPLWLGGATFDLRAGISHRGLHPTHHIAPDIDLERDTLTMDLVRVGQVASRFRVTGLGLRVDDHNAEGDRFETDGELRVLVLSPANATGTAPPEPTPPFLVRLKDLWWAANHRS